MITSATQFFEIGAYLSQIKIAGIGQAQANIGVHVQARDRKAPARQGVPTLED
jgi:hypothetical protein